MDVGLRLHLQNILGQVFDLALPISGGDINDAFLLKGKAGNVFVKINESKHAFSNFESERFGLKQIAKSKTISTPSLKAIGQFQKTSFLVMEYIYQEAPNNLFWSNLGRQLAQLHLIQFNKFGHQKDNFIGSLPQSNKEHATWSSFFEHERIRPQIKLANQSGLLLTNDMNNFELLFKKLNSILPNSKASMIHGDLWSGNIICGLNQNPFLVDPSYAQADREMDIAMSKLFGGFDKVFYDSYNEIFTLEKSFNERIQLLQLYYLLVHLNIFGNSYYKQTMHCLKKYL